MQFEFTDLYVVYHQQMYLWVIENCQKVSKSPVAQEARMI